MFVQGFESSVNKEIQKEKLVNSKTIIYKYSSIRTNLVEHPHQKLNKAG
jgi:hypothetical protein